MRNGVREFREKCGMTQKELGERVGVSRQAINAIETGSSTPRSGSRTTWRASSACPSRRCSCLRGGSEMRAPYCGAWHERGRHSIFTAFYAWIFLGKGALHLFNLFLPEVRKVHVFARARRVDALCRRLAAWIACGYVNTNSNKNASSRRIFSRLGEPLQSSI